MGSNGMVRHMHLLTTAVARASLLQQVNTAIAGLSNSILALASV
jgi:hypothetical protein